MTTLTLDPSAEDCSSSSSNNNTTTTTTTGVFQESTPRRPLQRPIPPPSSYTAAPHLIHIQPPSTRRQQQLNVVSLRKSHHRTQRRGPTDCTSTDDTVAASSTVVAPVAQDPVTGSDRPPTKHDNVAPTDEGEEETATASDNGQLSGSGSVWDEKTRRYNRISMIIIYGREALCILALILTTYATIQNSPPKVSKAPPPVPFFAKGSLVNDFPTGALGVTQTRVSVSELSFVLYYAPWCAESQHARHAYERIAQLYYREAHFAAINCWQPGGQCRQRYGKVQSWPVLMAYQPSGLAVQYHQAWTTSALSRFVQSLMVPLHRFSSPGDLMDHMTGKDAVIVAFLDITKHSKFYQRYYQASLKWLEKDPFQEVSFGVVTGQSSYTFGLETVPSIRLYLWNETVEYEADATWKPHELISWIHKQLHVVSMWIAPPGNVKSSTIAPYLRQGPVLMLFTPRPLYEDASDAYMMLRQLSMQYYNCPGDAWILEMAREYISEQRTANEARYMEKREQCVRILGRHPSQEEDDPSAGNKYGRNRCKDGFKSTVSVSFVNVLNSSKFVDGKPVGGKPSSSAEEYCDVAPAMGCGKQNECRVFGPGYRRSGLMWQSDGCPSQGRTGPETSYEPSRQVTSMIDSEHDYRGSKLLAKQHLRRQCELLQLAEAERMNVFFSEPPKQEPEPFDYYTEIGGLSCKHNNTLTFLSLDSNLYHAFGERLGVDVLNEPNRTVAFIVDETNESAYALRDPINLYTLAGFVHGYYNRTLTRFLRSGSVHYEHTHWFDAAELVKQDKLHLDKHHELIDAAKAKTEAEELEKQKVVERKQTNPGGDQAKMETLASGTSGGLENAQIVRAPREYHSVKEIYSSNFRRTVLESNRTVVVSYYSAQCAFCYVQSHHLLTVSRMLRHQPALWFVRIDGDRNDLPWEYTMDVFPTLVIFPNGRKAESRVFSQTLKINVPNILGFILSNLMPADRLHANFLLCSEANLASRNDCLQMLKRELTEGIRSSLLEWRQLTSTTCIRDRIVRRLQLLKQSYFDTLRCLSHSCDLTRLAHARKLIHELWTKEPHCHEAVL